jgi:hypothetical protein
MDCANGLGMDKLNDYLINFSALHSDYHINEDKYRKRSGKSNQKFTYSCPSLELREHPSMVVKINAQADTTAVITTAESLTATT